jgi:hypothetical protein
LDTRQQAALVKAQLATNDIVAALDNGGDWQTPLAAYKKVAVSPEKLDGFVNAFNSEPDWKNVVTQLVDVLGPCEEALPDTARDALRAARRLLGEKNQTERLDAGKQSEVTAVCLDQRAASTPIDSSDGQMGHQATTASPILHTVRSMTVGGRTVGKGFTCKYNGVDCEIAEVFKDGTVLLLRTCDGKAIAGDPIPIGELRFIAEKPKAASKRRKSQEQKPAGQTVSSEELSAGPTTDSPALGPRNGGSEFPDISIAPGTRRGDFIRNDLGKWEYDPLPQRFEQSAGA